MKSFLRAVWAARFYYWRWLRVVCGPSFYYADVASLFVPIALPWIGPPAAKAMGLKNYEGPLANLSWQIPLAVMLVIIVVRVVPAPYLMFKEDEAKRRAAEAEEEKRRTAIKAERDQCDNSLKALLELRETREKQRVCLAELMEIGDALQKQHPADSGQANEWMRQFGEWTDKVKSMVGRTFSAPHATHLFAAKIELNTKKMFAGGGKHQDAHARVCAITEELREMFRAVSVTE